MTEPSTINRFAVILLPTQACLDWIKSCVGDDDNLTLEELRQEPTVYLIPEGRAKPETYIRRHFKDMFEAELGSCYTDRTQWPKAVTFANFQKFFEIHVTSMVIDLGKGMIVKENED